MKWLEIIELRSSDYNRELLEAQVKELMNNIPKETEEKAIRAYSRVMVGTDFRIHVLHDSKEVAKSGSRLGLRLVSALKAFGLVNHSIWIELPTK